MAFAESTARSDIVSPTPEQKMLPIPAAFRLIPYFLATSLLVITAVTIVTGFLFVRFAEHSFIFGSEARSRDEAVHFVELFYQSVWMPIYQSNPDITLIQIDAALLEKFAQDIAFGLRIAQVNLVSIDGTLVYSTDPNLIGSSVDFGSNYDDTPNSEPSLARYRHDKTLTDVMGVGQRLDVIETFALLRDSGSQSEGRGLPIGVIEIIHDITKDLSDAKNASVRTATIGSVSMGLALVLLLFLIVRGADNHISHGRRRMIEQQQLLQESEKRLRSVVNSAPIFLLALDREGVFVSAEGRAGFALKYMLGDIIGRSVGKVFQELPQLLEDYNAAFAGQERTSVIHIVDETFEIRSSPMRDEEGDIAGVTFVATDITDRVKAERALLESEEQYRVLYEEAPLAYFSVGTDGRIAKVNHQAMHLLGYESADLIGLPVFELYANSEEGKDKAKGVFERFKSGLEIRDEEMEMIKADGSVISVGLTVRPIRDNEGTVVESRSMAVDITERKKAQDERIAYAEKLERAIRELEATQQQLVQSTKMAAIGELVSGVAHELNNPLTAVWGTSQLIMRRDIDKALHDDLTVIHQEASRAVKIVQNLLSFARNHKPEKQLDSVNDVLEKAIELRRYEMGVNGIELSTELQSDMTQTWFDTHQMQQVFLNIIVNAEQAMIEAHAGGKLQVKTHVVDEMIRVEISDDGPGISEENLEKIFNPFFTTKDVGKGTGLGLSLCYGIIQEHGGRISVNSAHGKGAAFTIDLPIISGDPKNLDTREG